MTRVDVSLLKSVDEGLSAGVATVAEASDQRSEIVECGSFVKLQARRIKQAALLIATEYSTAYTD